MYCTPSATRETERERGTSALRVSDVGHLRPQVAVEEVELARLERVAPPQPLGDVLVGERALVDVHARLGVARVEDEGREAVRKGPERIGRGGGRCRKSTASANVETAICSQGERRRRTGVLAQLLKIGPGCTRRPGPLAAVALLTGPRRLVHEQRDLVHGLARPGRPVLARVDPRLEPVLNGREGAELARFGRGKVPAHAERHSSVREREKERDGDALDRVCGRARAREGQLQLEKVDGESERETH